MKLSCIPVSFFRDIISGTMSISDWARMAKGVGLDAVDLSTLFVPDRSREAVAGVRSAIEAAGMRVAMVTSYPDFTHPDTAQRARELVLAEEMVDVAARLGAELIRVTAGQAHPETRRDAGIRWATEGLTALAERTRDSGVRLVYENHGKPGAWAYTDFSDLGTSNSAAAVLRGGRPVIIPSAEGISLGGKAFPSYVALTADGQTLVGEPARRQAAANPEGTASGLKRKMGKRTKIRLRNQEFSPEQLSAFLLQKIKRDAEAFRRKS